LVESRLGRVNPTNALTKVPDLYTLPLSASRMSNAGQGNNNNKETLAKLAKSISQMQFSAKIKMNKCGLA